MSKLQPRELTVIRKTNITKNMLRITLGGMNIHTIPDDQESAYVKLIFPSKDQKPLMRTYTIRHQRKDEIDIDFVLHKDGGPASSWALHSQPNDTILVGGPGPKKQIDKSAEWMLFVGDMTALPAISVSLEKLPQNSKGYAVLEVISGEDIQPLKHPDGIDIKWIINAQPGEKDSLLLEHVKSLNLPEDNISAWVACEFSSMKSLRSYLKNELRIKKENLYISSYWKHGNNEDQHKKVKQIDAEEMA
ncbi:NADPH-dependent ferric siderophore reductase [Marinomonas sp. CT5]|uniref:siderophore-interacting protein n=1 Tax=Marinomonas sp. CT5 TaxID=2066133 RepID=UPI001BAF5305|nr:siderophore-interacting protein [Marinomonas sp. CT5]QUX95882.1 NADPH-dependent ferric siderophore reductase [Marinomonas sp. CT5]